MKTTLLKIFTLIIAISLIFLFSVFIKKTEKDKLLMTRECLTIDRYKTDRREIPNTSSFFAYEVKVKSICNETRQINTLLIKTISEIGNKEEKIFKSVEVNEEIRPNSIKILSGRYEISRKEFNELHYSEIEFSLD